MTPKECFKVAYLTRLVDNGLSLAEIAEHVAELHSQLTKTAVIGAIAPTPPPTPAVATKPLGPPKMNVSLPPAPKIAGVGEFLMGAPKKLFDTVSSGVGAARDLGLTGLAVTGGAGLAGGYALGKMTDVDDTDIEETKQRELIDQYRRFADHARQTQAMHATLQATAKPHFGGRR